ncbi:DUF72 domain-containing protein [Pyrococcus abyssi]|uniref:DUF72 domain-containing protein n=1 Tax=Pyrococcus abyssi (strain GE5 / Orsay) TaxID=272844 RepID=Q9V2C3_PYRAB|nr:DUF72 domain-containing protein [Pyrococcus abyssi]CAB49075.1 Hypothetical protein PAB2251 [Pyrococcus abyssi GE5]CCE69527.1 TPA: hypothetical protein PAB2251 [Pyrococcus abyssi GE5]
MIRVGTCGFCEGKRKYFKDFDTVEIQQTFYRIMQERTLRRWKEEAPEGFTFSIKAFQGITHPPSSPTWRRSNVKPSRNVGLLKPTSEVFHYWRLTLKEAEVLGARFILIQLPRSFKENEESFSNAEKFFNSIERKDFEIAVELRGWSEKGIKEFVREFDVIDVTDPLVRIPLHKGKVRYYRLHGRYEEGKIIYNHSYSDEELKKLRERVLGWNIEESFVFFNNVAMCKDAKRFKSLLDLH